MILNFPSNPNTGDTYTGDNGTIYRFDGEKWKSLPSVTSSSDYANYASVAGIATVAQGLTGTPDINVGVATASSFSGDGSNDICRAPAGALQISLVMVAT